MLEYIKEIKKFFERGPRFNMVLIKSSRKVNEEDLGKELNCELVDIQKLVAEGILDIKKINGYTNLLDFLRHKSNEVSKWVVLINLDLLLPSLNKEKRKYFFESVLRKTFPKPIILIISIFRDEVPDVSYQEFNYAKVIELENSHGT